MSHHEHDPPEPDRLWITHGRRTVHTGRAVRVEVEDVTAPAGDRFDLDRVVLPPVAVALVVDERDRVLVLRTHRHVVGRDGWELPGGLVAPGEDPADAAAREAAEETGWRPVGRGRTLAAFEPLPGSVSAPMTVHTWSGATPVDEPLDPYEPGRARWLPVEDLLAMVPGGELLGSGTLVGLLALHAERTRATGPG